MNHTTRKAGQRFQDDEDSATQRAAAAVGRAAESKNYEKGGIYNSGETIGGATASVNSSLSDAVKRGDFGFDNSSTANNDVVNRNIENFRANASKYDNTSSIAQRAIDNAEKNRYINTEAIDERIGAREMYNKAKSNVTRSEIFGDVWKNQYIDDDLVRAPWQTAEPGKEVETPDWEDMYNTYTDFDKKK